MTEYKYCVIRKMGQSAHPSHYGIETQFLPLGCPSVGAARPGKKSPTGGYFGKEVDMDSSCKAKKFQDRMSHRGSGKAVGERTKASGSVGKSAGEKAMGNMTKQLSAKSYPHKQSKDGNGGK